LPRQPEEKQTLTIVAFLDGFKFESDRDYHVGIRDAQGLTMVVEFPAPGCLTGSHLKAQAKAGRKALEQILNVPITTSYKKMKKNTVRLQVTGVFFWGKSALRPFAPPTICGRERGQLAQRAPPLAHVRTSGGRSPDKE
jgi:hypothetical protein